MARRLYGKYGTRRGVYGVVGQTQYIEGLNRATAALRNVQDAYGMRGDLLLDSLYEGAKIIRDAARRNVQHTWKLPYKPEGRLKPGIIAKTFKPGYPDRPGAFAGIDYSKTSGTGAPHAHLVEYGHMTANGKHTQAYPFFRPAVDQNRTHVMMLIKKEMQTLIQKAAAEARMMAA